MRHSGGITQFLPQSLPTSPLPYCPSHRIQRQGLGKWTAHCKKRQAVRPSKAYMSNPLVSCFCYFFFYVLIFFKMLCYLYTLTEPYILYADQKIPLQLTQPGKTKRTHKKPKCAQVRGNSWWDASESPEGISRLSYQATIHIVEWRSHWLEKG